MLHRYVRRGDAGFGETANFNHGPENQATLAYFYITSKMLPLCNKGSQKYYVLLSATSVSKSTSEQISLGTNKQGSFNLAANNWREQLALQQLEEQL